MKFKVISNFTMAKVVCIECGSSNIWRNGDDAGCYDCGFLWS